MSRVTATPRPAHVPGPVILVLTSAAYIALAALVVRLDDPVELGMGFWPAAGLTTAALLLLPTRRWGWVLAGVVLAQVGGSFFYEVPAGAVVGWTAANLLGPIAGAGLVRRTAGGRCSLVPLRNLVRFLAFGVGVGAAVSGTVSAVGAVVVQEASLLEVWPQYVITYALGVLVAAPVLLSWRHGSTRRSTAETATLTSSLVIVGSVVFRSWGVWDVSLPHLLVPLLVWASIRYGLRGAAWSMLWITQAGTWATASGTGPFALAGAPTGQAVVLLQLYLAVTALSVLVIAALVDDLSDRAEVERSLTHQARHDVLTGLPNRAFVASYLQELLDVAGARADGVALLLCDLDDFKVVNDGLGPAAGDQVLVEIGRRLEAIVRPGDVVARLGADEYAIVVENPEQGAVVSLATRLQRAVAEPIGLASGAHVSVNASVGIATASPDHDAPELLRDADAALNRAKEQGHGRIEWFDEDLRVEVMERLTMPQELRAGLVRRELFCLHQPEIDIATGQLFSVEALVRWSHPERGTLSPIRFIPTVESAGLAGSLFAYVLDETLEAQQRWATHLGFRPAISVNLSPKQLHDTMLPAAVATALTRTGVPAELLWLEVTETAVADATSFETLAELHELGVRLAIDDFGTGWSSMARLSRFPWDLLKIDRSFVSRLGEDPQAEHVVRAMIVMAHALGIRTVAEGVETEEQLEVLASLDCDVAQGYLFAKPLAANAIAIAVAPDGRWIGQNHHVLPAVAPTPDTVHPTP